MGPPRTPNVPAWWRGVGGRVLMGVGASTDGCGARDVPRLAGARVDGGLRAATAATGAARARRWVRIWSLNAAWVMSATTRMGPPHVGHASGSTSKIYWWRAAQRRPVSAGARRGAAMITGGASNATGSA